MPSAIDYSTFGRAIKTARLARGKTQAEVAASAGISKPMLSYIETERVKTAAPHTVVRIARALRLSTLRLLALGAPKKRSQWESARRDEERKAS